LFGNGKMVQTFLDKKGLRKKRTFLGKERLQEIKGICKHPLSIFPPNNLSLKRKVKVREVICYGRKRKSGII